MLTAESHDRSIFEQPGNYYYQTTILSSEDDFIFNDTLQLETYGKKWMYDDIQWQIGWHYPMDIRTFKTGVVVSEDSIWMHPPRNGLFSILEGNAFPCVYPNDSIHQKRTITIRANPKDWFQLDGLDSVGVVSFFSEYVRLEDSLFTLGNETEKAFHYQAITTSPLGNSLSEFYYTQKWGFVRMRFETLRNERIDMELANIHKAQSQL
jgi:hypothetical protein